VTLLFEKFLLNMHCSAAELGDAMKLKSFRVTEFRSIKDSGEVQIGDITCLVGKNEAGKTALLKALYRLSPVAHTDHLFDVTQDYPRMDVEDYRHAVEAGSRDIAVPIRATFEMEDAEVSEIEGIFGPNCLINRQVTLSKDYNNQRTFNLSVRGGKALEHLANAFDVGTTVKQALKDAATDVTRFNEAVAAQEDSETLTPLKQLAATLAKEKDGVPRGINGYIWDKVLAKREPEFLYFDEYYQLSGHENLEALMSRQQSDTLKPSDLPLMGLVKLARLKLEEMIAPESTTEMVSKLEGASNHLSKQVLKYWSQNKHLKMKFDVRPARPKDPEGMRSGSNLWGGVVDTRYDATTELGSRSRGFVWFFSFLAWYSDVKRNAGTVILLLDEPGLTLHAKAQFDLLKYFDKEVLEHNQLIYTTHSPFMVDPEHFERVRIVQDKSIETDQYDEDEAGTQVLSDVFAASADSLFPLQGALGYDIFQTLFVGPYNIVVEGAADLLILQAVSAHLSSLDRVTLDSRWTITPVGGAAKVPTFVALIGANQQLIVATLLDHRTADSSRIESLYKDKLLKKSNVFAYTDFTGAKESDVEDMLGDAFYVDLVNAEFKDQLAAPFSLADLPTNPPYILGRVEAYLNKNPMKTGAFSHFRPARYLSENIGKLGKKIPKDALGRFEQAFEALNKLLPKE
jgi:predicted ATPase